jgi:hypothetical protein
MNSYLMLKYLHSGWRYVVLALVLIAIITAFAGWFGKNNYTNGNRKLNLFAMISMHIQLLIGLVLYFMSPKVNLGDFGGAMKDAVSRYWTVEHALMMIIAVIIITIGHSKSKKTTSGANKHKTVAIYYTISLAIVIGAIYMSGYPILGMS